MHYFVMDFYNERIDSYWYTEKAAEERLSKINDTTFEVISTTPQKNALGQIFQEGISEFSLQYHERTTKQ